MSKVAAIVFVGFCFLTGCKETSQQSSIHQSIETHSIAKTSPKENPSQIPDIFIVDDPNDLIALENLSHEVPVEVWTQSKKKPFSFIIKPRSDIDYKIIAVKPNPDIDYKILNPYQNFDHRLRKFRKELDEDKQRKLRELERKYQEQLEQSRQKPPQETQPPR